MFRLAVAIRESRISLRLSEIIRSGNFVRLVELFPPGLPAPASIDGSQKYDLTFRFERLVVYIFELETLADAFSFPELKDPTRIHLNSIALASELKRLTSNDVIPTLTLRDSNRHGLLGLITYALFAGLENLQIVRGDPYDPKIKSEPKNVYDVSTVSSLVKIVRKIESSLSNVQSLCILAPINLLKISDKNYIQTIKDRESSGVDIFVSESLFEDAEIYLERVSKIRELGVKTPIIHSIFPFRSYEDAVSCTKKFGWKVSEEELHQLKARGGEYSIELSRERYHKLLERKDVAQGACISTRGNVDLARRITS